MIVYTVIAIVWILRILLNLLSYIQLWYVKEYRFDRLIIHLKATHPGKLYFPPLKRPPITPKSISIFLATVIIATLFFFSVESPILLRLLCVDLLLFPLTGLLVALMKAPTGLYHMWLIQKARMLLREQHDMLVAGITGSFGKTSTKEYLSTLLSTKFTTLKTEASKNSPIGIAEVVLQKLTPKHQMFVVEMGAYMSGEISQMCELVQPEVGIITAINPQHQDLFGSIEGTIKAKYELAQGIHGKKILIINYDNVHTRAMGERAKKEGCNVQFYSVKQKTDWYATDIRQEKDGISFTVWSKSAHKKVTVGLLGIFHAGNILAAVAASVNMGLSFDEAISACRSINPIPKTMQLVKTNLTAICIDDTFNNNPDAAVAAIAFLQQRSGKKILVFQPMIELGAYAQSSHELVGEHAGKACDAVILTNDSYFNSFNKGLKKASSSTTLQVLSNRQASEYLQQHTSKGDTVLFKGKESARVLALVQ